jgi:OOP family OmpA-OmpF porin
LQQNNLIVGLFALIMATTTASFANAETCPDLPGFAPLEGIQVYRDACLFGAEDAGFAQHRLPIGPMKGRELSAFEPLEGQLQRRLYVAPEGVSPADLMGNYRQSLAAAGFETIFECAGRDCGSNNGLLGKLVIYGPDRKLRNLKADSEFALYIDKDERFLSAKSADGSRYIAVYVAQNRLNGLSKQARGRAAVHIDLLTTAALQSAMIDAAAMAKGITEEGHVAVDNVFFDFGTAILTPEAAPALAEMAKLMADNPGLKVFIVGHTDWVGDADANLALSRARAEAVVAALVAQGVAADRVEASGVGMLSPRATNTTDAGRQLNRRVELVERGG